ncbi:hypothetical protein [Thalassospira marina]|uniref:Uncharacterized protein n=1 Tax=Thalassospira marina TaxID=2048283 RepID=A0A2N3KV87_9PROT|nr:hypothetical protein [Thalassospira marina]PKR54448.1 hypothetical protein COO20_09980 [Thalassospira marina]
MPVTTAYTYEVRVRRGDRWIIHATYNTEKEATSEAENVLRGKVAAVRVVRDWEREDGRHIEKVLLEKEGLGEADNDPVRVTPIEDAALCETDDDLLGVESRSTINRLLRKYFEQEVLTPTEVMYNFKNMRKLMYHDTLLPSAVDRVATIHSRTTEGNHIEASNKLHRAIDTLAARARQVEKYDLPQFEDATIAEVRREIQSLRLAEDTDFLTMVALTRELSSSRSWIGKLDFALKVKGDPKDDGARAMVDDVVADILGSPVALKDLLGPSRSFGDAVLLHIDLALGKAKGNRGAAQDVLDLLNPLFAAGLLPKSQFVLFDYVARELKSPNSFSRHDDDADQLVQVLDRLLNADGVVFGQPMVEALVERGARVRNVGGSRAFGEGVEEIVGCLAPGWRRLAFLSEVTKNERSADIGSELMELTRKTVADMRGLRAFCGPEAKPREKMAMVTRMHEKVVQSNFVEELKHHLSEKLDSGLADYLTREKVIERIDNPDLHLRQRAYMLVKFCSSGVLIEGKSATMARKRVVGYLRQPNFTERLVDDLQENSEKEGTLRDFYALLQRSGF